MPSSSDHDMDDMLRSLPPAPDSWIARAEELPKLQRALAILAVAQGTPGAAELEAALREAGLEPDERRVRTLERLRSMSG